MRRVLETDAGGRALRQTPDDDRTDLRRHQVQPPHRSFLTPRQGRRQIRMAPDQRRPQPAQALAAHQRPGSGLSRPPRRAHSASPSSPPTPSVFAGTPPLRLTQQPPWKAAVAAPPSLPMQRSVVASTNGTEHRATGDGLDTVVCACAAGALSRDDLRQHEQSRAGSCNHRRKQASVDRRSRLLWSSVANACRDRRRRRRSIRQRGR